MDKSVKLLSDITVFSKYARYIPELERRETWNEICIRNMDMHIEKYPHMRDEIVDVYKNFVFTKKVLPSMRSLQFGGRAIELAPSRIYNCFSSETEFVTTKGVFKFSDFNDGDIVYVPTHLGNVKKAVVRCYGEQKLYDITFTRTGGRNEKVVRATKNHRWILKNGESTTNLSVGDYLLPTPNTFRNFDYDDANPLERLYWCYGYIYGDGTVVTTRTGKEYSMARLCGKDSRKFLKRFEEMGFKSSTPLSCNGDPMVYTGTYTKTAPTLDVDSVDMVRAFVKGYLDADGYKNSEYITNKDASMFKSIQSSQLDHIKFIEDCFEAVGVYLLSKRDLTGRTTNFGVRPETYSFGLSNSVGSFKGTGTGNWRVKDIAESNVENVWCLEVEDDHSFILSGGMVTGNCSYGPLDHPDMFSETMFLLLGGSGVGYSVQKHHIDKLPVVQGTKNVDRRFLIDDSITGWSDAVKVLIEAYFYNKYKPRFDYRDIRAEGLPLKTSGGKAPGPEPLKKCLEAVEKILIGAIGRKLRPIEAHDIQCHIASSVVSGGIRRSAMISTMSYNDEEMLTCKQGNWWENNPQRAMANNSAVLLRGAVTEEEFKSIWKKVEASGSGEPAVYWTNDLEIGTNPCGSFAALFSDGQASH